MSVDTTLAARALSPTRPDERRRADAAAAATPDPSIGFEDVLDAVNPLQQLPGVSAVYREVSGDAISIPSRLAGGFLFGGPTGAIAAAAMVLFEEITGDSVLGHLRSLADGTPADGTPTGATPAAPLPWLAEAGPQNDGPPPAAASAASLAEALKRETAAAVPGSAAVPTSADALPPQTLAKLYALEATDARGEAAIRL